MTYDEKLDLILKALVEAKKAAIKGHSTKLYINEESGLSQIGKDEVRDILYKLEVEEKILSIDYIYNRFLTLAEQPKNLGFLLIDFRYKFESWYENYLIKSKTNVQNLDYINMLRIYDVVLDINEQIQLTHKISVAIHLLPSLIRFSVLFPADTIGMRDKYCETRWDSLKYLQEQGIIQEFKHNSAFHRWDTIVTVTLTSLSKFDGFYRTIMAEYVKRNQADKKDVETIDKPTQSQLSLSNPAYDSQKGVLSIDGKTVRFKKDSFRAKLLELLLKDDKSKTREWSWDEVIEGIEDTNSEELTQENKAKFYPACDGLSKHIALKTGINDLLIFNKSTVQINPKYFNQ